MVLPVYDALGVQEHKSRRDFSSIEPSTSLLKPPRLLDVKHEVTAVHKFHNKKQTILGGRNKNWNVKMLSRIQLYLHLNILNIFMGLIQQVDFSTVYELHANFIYSRKKTDSKL